VWCSQVGSACLEGHDDSLVPSTFMKEAARASSCVSFKWVAHASLDGGLHILLEGPEAPPGICSPISSPQVGMSSRGRFECCAEFLRRLKTSFQLPHPYTPSDSFQAHTERLFEGVQSPFAVEGEGGDAVSLLDHDHSLRQTDHLQRKGRKYRC
jgi:hypothetical protein